MCIRDCERKLYLCRASSFILKFLNLTSMLICVASLVYSTKTLMHRNYFTFLIQYCQIWLDGIDSKMLYCTKYIIRILQFGFLITFNRKSISLFVNINWILKFWIYIKFESHFGSIDVGIEGNSKYYNYYGNRFFKLSFLQFIACPPCYFSLGSLYFFCLWNSTGFIKMMWN